MVDKKHLITIKTEVSLPIEKVWNYWNEPKHIVNWNAASDDWHTTSSKNDLKVGGKLESRMEAKDGSFGFDFIGVYKEIKIHEYIAFVMDDERKVTIKFHSKEDSVEIIESFEAENENSLEMQELGWQAILNNFKKYAENLG